MTMNMSSRHWLLARRPTGNLALTDFECAVRPLPSPQEGEVLIRVLYLAMDPAIRGFMNASGNYASPIPLGEPVRGMVLGQIVESHSPLLSTGQLVWGFGTWSEYVIGPAAQYQAFVPAPGIDLAAYTHALGTIGLTAHYGLLDIGAMHEGDCVLVSAAAGAVGSLVGQIARIKGAKRIIGIAGGSEKCATAVQRYGYDECLDYKSIEDLPAAIAKALPDGIDVHFENVGSPLLEAALAHLAKNARIALCGMISGYNTVATAQPTAVLWNLVVKTAQIKGFRATDIIAQKSRAASILEEITGWVQQGRLVFDIDQRAGFESIPAVFNELFSGTNHGRLVVKIASL